MMFGAKLVWLALRRSAIAVDDEALKIGEVMNGWVDGV